MSLPEPYSRNAQGAQEIDFHHVPLQSAIRSGVLQDPTLEAQLAKQFPSATKQLNDIISSKSAVPMPAERTSTPTVIALNSSATVQEATTSVDRVNTSVKTPTYRFSMVYAVSQRILNQSFENLFVVNETLQAINYDYDATGMISSELMAPNISLPVVGADAPLWYMNFGVGGTFSYYELKSKKMVQVPTDNWILVFRVNLVATSVDSGTDDHAAVKKAIGTNNPSDCDITRLEMDLRTAPFQDLRWDLCKLPGLNITNDMKIALNLVLSVWANDAADSNAGTLGYVWTTRSPYGAYPNAPAFAPTDKIFQTYPYLATPTSVPVQGLDIGEDNMLLYLGMTQYMSFPPERAIPYKANWTTPNIPATMCIGSAVFFDSFLMRSMYGNDGKGLLGQINAATWMDALNTTAKYGIKSSFSWEWGLAPHDPWFYDWDSNGPGYVWHQRSEKSATDNTSPGCYAKSGITTETANSMVVAQGGNSFTFSGVSTVTLTTDIVVFGVHQSSSSTVKNTWNITMTVNSIPAGGLQLNMNLPANDSDLFKITTSKSSSWNQPDSLVNQIVSDMARQSQVNRIRSAAQELQTVLNGTGKFFFPGCGTLIYGKAMFNNEKDLLVEVSYDGTTDAFGRKAAGRFAKK